MKTLFATYLVSVVAIAQIARAQTHEFSPPLRATQLMGLKVEDTDGQKVGTVRNLILDTRTGQIKYAVIGSGGFMGVKSTLRLAPAQMMSAATAKRETLSLNTTLARWKGAPTFNRSQLASLAEPQVADQITRYFGQPDLRATSASQASLPATVSGAGGRTNVSHMEFAGDLIGRIVVNRQRQKIGEVVDLLVDFSRTHPAFAIVSTGKLLWHGREYAIPVATLSPAESHGRLVVDADMTTLQKAPPFNQQVWDTPALQQSAVFTYSKLEQ